MPRPERRTKSYTAGATVNRMAATPTMTGIISSNAGPKRPAPVMISNYTGGDSKRRKRPARATLQLTHRRQL